MMRFLHDKREIERYVVLTEITLLTFRMVEMSDLGDQTVFVKWFDQDDMLVAIGYFPRRYPEMSWVHVFEKTSIDTTLYTDWAISLYGDYALRIYNPLIALTPHFELAAA